MEEYLGEGDLERGRCGSDFVGGGAVGWDAGEVVRQLAARGEG